MDNKDKDKISEEELNKEIDELKMQEVEFDFESSTLEIENDDMMKFAKSRGKKKKE